MADEIINIIVGVKTPTYQLERFSQYTDKAVSYQVSDYPLGEILAKLAYEKAVNNEETDWRKLKPLYIQPPPVFGK